MTRVYDSVKIAFEPVRYRGETRDSERYLRVAAREMRSRFAAGYRKLVLAGANDEAIDRAMRLAVELSPEARLAYVNRMVAAGDTAFAR